MRTLQEKYNGINEGKFTKDQFLRDARMEQPSLVTQYNGYDDAVKILKNRGMIQEAKVDTETLKDVLRGGKKIASGVRFINAKDYKDGNKVGTLEKGDQVLDSKELKEARITNKSLPDYRYKVTNDMDKYPYEQILRGLRVELEGLNILGTPTPEEYKKALGKVLKNLEKDTIFYTNQVAGVSKKVDLHDKMVDVKKDNAVDKFNGLKKAQLKEAIKGVIKNILSENSEFGEGEGVYEMQGPKEDSYYKSELSDYLDDNGIFGYTDRIHSIMTGPDEAENVDELVRFLEDNQIYGYGSGIERIYADYPYDQHWMNQEDEDDDIPHPRGYEEASDEETFGDLFKENKSEEEKSEEELRAEWKKYQATCHPEDRIDYMEWRSEQGLDEAIDTEADKNMVRKFMAMYETEPSKFERLHKQAQTQAATTKDIKFKHLLSLFNRAKAGIEGMDEIATDITGFPKWRELGQDEKDHISKFVKDTGDRDQAEYEKRKAERLKAQSDRLSAYIASKKDLEENIFESVSLFDILDESYYKKLGKEAFIKRKLKRNENPYSIKSPVGIDWDKGWDEAQSEESDAYKGY